MPEYLAPGVYVEEVSFGAKSIEGVSTSTTGFVSVSGRGALLGPLTSFVDFERAAPPSASANLSLAVRGFFDNGGQRCFISQIAPGDPIETGLSALDQQPISIVCCPDDPTIPSAPAVLAAHCEKRKDRVCILQSPQPVIPSANHQPPVHSSYAAYYYPWLGVPALSGSAIINIPPCGHVAGIYAQTDTSRGVWKAPANVPIVGVQSLSAAIDTAESDLLQSRGINTIRSFPGQGIRVWGALTTSADPEWKYVNVRRYLVFLEHSIDQGTQWAVFEPYGPALWAAVCACIQSFLFNQWKSGALQGQTAQEAYFVRRGRDTMTQSDLDKGRLVIIVGIAPLRPAEFVIIQITIITSSGSHTPAHR
jgi:uncharacterized protein